MKVRIVTPYRIAEFSDAKLVVFRTVEGEMGVLDKRAPIIAKLAITDVRIEFENSREVYRVVDGFIHCDGNSNVVVLTEEMGRPEEFDPHKYLGNGVESQQLSETGSGTVTK
ncbi:MAG TPA: F0F1 ATP synthase subunit epsilon [Fervidobacterium sp.]|nr:F0F1 ATP synthase subunit epsilon [Fervidobacterium sp.]HOK87899.1 F0F1 ATP synthase subunit epsilon [Fervidobacterium sp.]HQE49271.1 F0F1 ATP synthase subunit epsilon [Fervidobacterium sp.]HUM43038.1 F0F1 ATP synthase subunit epsilon [Fervidobacterium sp.]